MNNFNYKIELTRNSEGGLDVFVPALPGCSASGYTIDQAIENSKIAIERHINMLLDNGEQIPDEENFNDNEKYLGGDDESSLRNALRDL